MYIQTCGEEDVKYLLTQAHACKHTHTHTKEVPAIWSAHTHDHFGPITMIQNTHSPANRSQRE